MTGLYDRVLAHKDPYDFIYECISGTHGEEAQKVLTEFYSDVAVDYGLHPDDDFEKIIAYMFDLIEDM